MILLTAAVSVGVFLFVFQNWMDTFYDRVRMQRRQDLTQLVSVARNAVEPILIQVRSGKLSEREGRERVRELVRSMTYEDQYGRNYIFMSAYDGTMLVQPFEPEKEMTNQWDLRDAHGLPIIQELIHAARRQPGGEFVRYFYHLPGVHSTQEKLAFVMGLPELQCYIGTGMYMQRAIQEQQTILHKARYASIGLVILILLSVAVAIRAMIQRNRLLLAEVEARSRTEEALRYSERRYRELVESANSIILRMDLDGRIQFFNDFAETLFGYPRDEVLGRSVVGTIVPETSMAGRDLRSMISSILANPEQYQNNENENMCKDGRRLWISWSNRGILDQRGRMVGVLSVGIDQTKQREMGRALIESEEKLRTIFENVQDALFIHDTEGQILDVNPAMIALYGLERDRALKLNFLDLCHPNAPLETLGNLWHVLNLGGSTQLEWVAWRPDSQESFDAEISICKFQYGGQEAILASVRDISQRKKAERALLESRNVLSAIIENTPNVAIQGFDRDGRVLLWNSAAESIFGWNHEDALGKSLDELMLSREGLDRFLRVLRDIEATERPSGPHEWDFRGKDGREGTSLATIFGIRGGLMGIELVRMDVDITGLKRAEEERLAMERRFLHAQKLESLGVLAGGIAHDFNNLLMAIMGNLEQAMERLSPEEPARTTIERAARAADRAGDLTRQLLAYTGKGSFRSEPVDLNALVRENAHLFKTVLSKSVSLELNLTPNLPFTHGDQGQLQQVIMNLLTNASEAMGEKCGTVVLSTSLQELSESDWVGNFVDEKPPAGLFVVIEVSDTGEGMDEETRRRLFEPFYSTKFAGRGLGLSAVLGIVRRHHGALFVESALNEGTRIRVFFPADLREGEAFSHPVPDIARAEPAHLAGRSLTATVLVVEDEESIRNLCRETVELNGCRALTAADGEEGVAVFREHADEIACVILDMTMPRLDGVAVLEELRRMRPAVKVILISGFSEQRAERLFADQKPNAFLQKPFTLSRLMQELVRCLDEGT
jgi:PAS domain S-box-containing protein